MTPQEAYEKRYAHIDGGQHTWDVAPPHIKEQWLAAWTIGWAMGEEAGREAVAGEYVDKMISVYQQGRDHGCEMEPITDEKLHEIISAEVNITAPSLYDAVYTICRNVEAAHGILEDGDRD